MKPEFVLSEDGIKERFKYSRSSGFHQHHPGLVPKENTVFVPKQENEYDEYNSMNPGPSYVRVSVIQRAQFKTEEESVIKQDCPQNVIGDSTMNIDPYGQSPVTVSDNQLVSRLQSQNYDLTKQLSDQTRQIQELNKQLEMLKNVNSSKPIEYSGSPVVDEPENNPSILDTGSNIMVYQNNQEDYDNLIMNYIHKKFKKSWEQDNPIVPIEYSAALSDDSGHSSDTEREVLTENFNIETEEEDIESLIQTLSPQLDNFQIENKILEDMKSSFLVNWRSTNFGEEAMKLYMDFCAGRKEMDFNFWSYVFLQLR